MLDIRWIRENPGSFDRALARRGLAPLASSVLELDRDWRAAQTSAEQLQAERNRLSKDIGAAKSKGGDADDLLRRVAESKEEQAQLEARAQRLRAHIDETLAPIPNVLADDVPDGRDDSENGFVRQHGAPPKFDFPVKD